MEEVETLEFLDPDTTCKVCDAEFLDPEDLEIHIAQVHSQPERLKRNCHFCAQSFSDIESYALHIRDVHLLSLKCCKFCCRVFNDIDQYRKHGAKHHRHQNTSLFTCSQCKNTFSNITELEQHELKEHADCSDGVLLHECFPILSSIINIKFSRFVQSYGECVVYVCVMCEYSTPDVNEYISHLKQKDCRSLVCDICSSVYKERKGLIRHILKHRECYHGSENCLKKCPECFKMIDLKMWKDHTKHCKAIKCKKCDIVFDSVSDMYEHQTLAHPNMISLVTCKYCHKEFVGTVSLEKHLKRAHQPQFHLYKYKCIYCNSFFKHPKNLFAHYFSRHKDIEPYTCKICDKKFKIRKKFTIHIKLDHKSIGYIEFDENFHVFFSDKKSEKPFNPTIEGAENTENENIIDDQAVAESDDAGTNIITNTQDDLKTIVTKNKVTFDVEEKEPGQMNLVNVNSDFMSATETEGNATEVEIQKSSVLKRKMKKSRKRKKNSEVLILDESSDDEPLLKVKRRAIEMHKARMRNATWNTKKVNVSKENKQMFVCSVCNKNCYTYQNYHNHISLHKDNVTSTCVKCAQEFNSKDELNEHYKKEHASSQLTETLKSLLERRKKGVEKDSDMSNSEKFLRTIKRVDLPQMRSKATVTPVGENALSVQKFIENFTPESEAPKVDIIINNSVTIKPVKGQIKKPLIKMTKCNLAPTEMWETKLSLPVRFKPVIEQHKATLRVLKNIPNLHVEESFFKSQDLSEETELCEDDNIDRNVDEEVEHADSIPDVAQEVMLENTEEPKPKQITQKIVLSKLTEDINKIRIAQMQPQAPYYKIVKMKDILGNRKETQKKTESKSKNTDITLPDGSKWVSVNPLAHLLGDTPVEKILGKSKHYQPKSIDFETAIANALLKLKSPAEVCAKKSRKKVDIEQ